MYDLFLQLAELLGLNTNLARIAAFCATIISIVILCIVVRLLAKLILVGAVSKTAKRKKHAWSDILLKNKVLERVADVSIPVVISLCATNLPRYNQLIYRINGVISTVIFIFLLNAVVSCVDEIYQQFEISKVRPIRGVLQIIKIFIFIVGAVIGISFLAGQPPLLLLGSIGAMTALISLIFKDAIIGFVAGIQLTANDMIRIGDWVEMPKYSANGSVIDLSMTTVKVQNFDNSVTSIPAYTLVSDAFINWRGMETSGGRRIKRAVYIDATCVKLCDKEMLEKFKKIELIKEHIDNKLTDIDNYNNECHADLSVPVNGRRLTNIGVFRAYLYEYIKRRPDIHRDMTIIVRQLTPDDKGLPMEIYAFTKTTDWAEYEGIQSDIFDHIYAVAQTFGLHIYQKPSSTDVRRLADNRD